VEGGGVADDLNDMAGEGAVSAVVI